MYGFKIKKEKKENLQVWEFHPLSSVFKVISFVLKVQNFP